MCRAQALAKECWGRASRERSPRLSYEGPSGNFSRRLEEGGGPRRRKQCMHLWGGGSVGCIRRLTERRRALDSTPFYT